MKGTADRRLTRLVRGRADIAVALRPEGEGFLYRPRQLLVDAEDARRDDVTNVLDHLGASTVDVWRNVAQSQPDSRMVWQPPRCRGEGFEAQLETSLGLVVRYLPPNVSVPSVVDHLRSDEFASVDRWPVCGVNHVAIGEQAYGGDPADDPCPTNGPVNPSSSSARAGAGVTVGVLDTGIDVMAKENHPILDGRFVIQPGDIDVLDGPDPNRLLDAQAGHGTFVAGVLMQRAPAAEFDPQAVLDANGVGDDAHVSLALAAMLVAGRPIVNMSLGGYTQDNRVPLGLDCALRTLDRVDAVVIAAAGNNGKTQPFWPAADERVLGVAALDCEGGPAEFSNFGSWVDACAVGVRVASTFVRGDWDPANMHRPSPAPTFTDPYATWSGTSFAAPRLAGAVAERMAVMEGPKSARQAAKEVLDNSDPGPTPDFGKRID